ncbi:hypothetical protein [Scytonema sp. NUACC26]|uniref:hypothetical protein n=1 Tax=Scytonema sp. NUACC26 TaxID=3140176 RepID=UPI0034DC6DC3
MVRDSCVDSGFGEFPKQLHISKVSVYRSQATLFLIGWFISWIILSFMWRTQPIRAKTIFVWMLLLVIAATVMSWHPLFPSLQIV